ncbi:TspO/MBR family protein [Micromonospora sp. NPDC051141]|uniref:TspO/MBR family protein n=1 Tax=Micromonospora sp. NPDC051141 TaxID=3364284 RepID=UPI0037A90CA9
MTSVWKTAAGVAATAVVGAVATTPAASWYRSLRKPVWQPPPAAFPAVWTPLYALIAVAAARVLDRTSGDDRTRFRRSFTANLLLNAGWSVLFFRARNPKAALAEIAALNVSNLILMRDAARVDRVAAAALMPYAAWTLFAAAVNTAIVAGNSGQPGSRGEEKHQGADWPGRSCTAGL